MRKILFTTYIILSTMPYLPGNCELQTTRFIALDNTNIAQCRVRQYENMCISNKYGMFQEADLMTNPSTNSKFIFLWEKNWRDSERRLIIPLGSRKKNGRRCESKYSSSQKKFELYALSLLSQDTGIIIRGAVLASDVYLQTVI